MACFPGAAVLPCSQACNGVCEQGLTVMYRNAPRHRLVRQEAHIEHPERDCAPPSASTTSTRNCATGATSRTTRTPRATWRGYWTNWPSGTRAARDWRHGWRGTSGCSGREDAVGVILSPRGRRGCDAPRDSYPRTATAARRTSLRRDSMMVWPRIQSIGVFIGHTSRTAQRASSLSQECAN